MSADDPYVYPGTNVLRNKFGIRDEARLDKRVAVISAARLAELALQPVDGRFDFAHLQNIHGYLLGEVYDWAGEIRTSNTQPGRIEIPHEAPEFIQGQADYLFDELGKADHLRGLDHEEFAYQLGGYWSETSHLHPFRDGNSRSQAAFFDQLSRNAGWAIDWREVNPDALHAARIFAVVDAGKNLTDVIAPAVKPVDEVPVSTLGQLNRHSLMNAGQHLDHMVRRIENEDNSTYSWPTQDEERTLRRREALAARAHRTATAELDHLAVRLDHHGVPGHHHENYHAPPNIHQAPHALAHENGPRL
ncbi:Fic/DOC family protein [Rhodococcus sp. NPDC003318]|uniref:Fic/DOC family protein n=1 Tax=Rhodococcus sp. NPDC003318 TaxID=3364503 RepID=UPI0036C08DB0